MFYLDIDPVDIDMDKVESGDSLALSEVNQSTDKLDKNEDNSKSTILQNVTKFFSPLLLSRQPLEPQNPTILEELRNKVNLLKLSYLLSLYSTANKNLILSISLY